MNTTPKEFKPILDELKKIREHLGELRDAIREHKTATERTAQAQQKQPATPPQMNAELHLSKAVEDAIAKQPSGRWQKANVFTSGAAALFTALAFVAAFWYACEAHKQSPAIINSGDAAKETADLNKKTLSATDAAICHPEAFAPSKFPDMHFDVKCDAGKIDGQILNGNVSFALYRLSNGTQIGDTIRFAINPELLRADRESSQIDFVLRDFDESAFYHLREKIVYSGKLLYDDGFDRQIPIDFCRTILPFRNTDGTYVGQDQADCGIKTEEELARYRNADKVKDKH